MTVEKFFEIAQDIMLYGETRGKAMIDENGNTYWINAWTGTRKLRYKGKEYILYSGEDEVRGPFTPCYGAFNNWGRE